MSGHFKLDSILYFLGKSSFDTFNVFIIIDKLTPTLLSNFIDLYYQFVSEKVDDKFNMEIGG